MGVSSVFLHGTSPPASAVLPRRFFAVILLYTLAYDWVMATFEGKERGFFESLLMVVETFTTTGYGEDADWQSPATILLVISMMFTGVFFIFMALPLFVVPWIEERLSTTPPTSIPGLTDHVVICTYTDRSETLVEELDVVDVDYVVVEPDRELATELFEDGVSVIHGDPESVEDLEAANLAESRALVADFDDEDERQHLARGRPGRRRRRRADHHLRRGSRPGGLPPLRGRRHRVLAAPPHRGEPREQGDDRPHQRGGRRCRIADDFEIAELPVQSGSRIAGVTVAESRIRERTGAHIIGAWFRGEFVTPPSPSARIDERTILLVAGRDHQLETLKGDDSLGDQAEPPRVGRRRRLRRGRVDRQSRPSRRRGSTVAPSTSRTAPASTSSVT